MRHFNEEEFLSFGIMGIMEEGDTVEIFCDDGVPRIGFDKEVVKNKKAIHEEGCFYITAINDKNAMRKAQKCINDLGNAVSESMKNGEIENGE